MRGVTGKDKEQQSMTNNSFCRIVQVVSKTVGLVIAKTALSVTEVIGVSGCFTIFGVCVLLSITVGFFFMEI